jgi:glycosyltransferase family protein
LPKVASIDETLDRIISTRSSICRYGDGEFLLMLKQSINFQLYNSKLRNKMIEILSSEYEHILIGLPYGYFTLDNLKKNSRLFWRSHIVWIYPRIRKYLTLKKQYFNASMTRPYIDLQDKSNSIRYFNKLKKIWDNRDILLIEGHQSRLGVGNDLFENASSLIRILAPASNAFDKYDVLLAEILKYNASHLILIALGPTATVMAYDLAIRGYQAIDIGNVDIEYEWYLRNSKEKVKIVGKYSNEAAGGRDVEDISEPLYENQIVRRIL